MPGYMVPELSEAEEETAEESEGYRVRGDEDEDADESIRSIENA